PPPFPPGDAPQAIQPAGGAGNQSGGALAANRRMIPPSLPFGISHVTIGQELAKGGIHLNRERSEALYEQALDVIVGGVNSPSRSFRAVGGGSPVFMKRAQGAYFWDEDGNRSEERRVGKECRSRWARGRSAQDSERRRQASR